MTYGKLRQFRRDRLYMSDRERVGGLTEFLKRARITDDQQNCETCLKNGAINVLPSKQLTNKNLEKGISPNKSSPNKTMQNRASNADHGHSGNNNGQVMTQISAIYSKRSRSILNQFGQSNNPPNGQAQPNYLAHPPSNQPRQSIANQDAQFDNSHSKGSPRMGRLRGISSQSREKTFISGTNNSNLNF